MYACITTWDNLLIILNVLVGALRFNIYKVGGRVYLLAVVYICWRSCTFVGGRVHLLAVVYICWQSCTFAGGRVYLLAVVYICSTCIDLVPVYTFSITFLTCGIFCFSFYFIYSNACMHVHTNNFCRMHMQRKNSLLGMT